jgi:PTS system fructose-specific IIA component/PTS system nitrogen regulatory IIA component
MGGNKQKDIMLTGLLKERFIDLELQGKDKNEIIYNLVELIAASKKLKNKKAFFKTVLERERLGSTGIGGGVAIPHAKAKTAGGFILVFARIDGGIDFGALDGEKTYLFFALASPDKEVGGHLKILAEISRLVKDKFIVERLKKARDKKEVLKIISMHAK